jgi:hypothetical protein
MSTAASKILRTANASGAPDAVELLVGQALLDLESSVAELKAELRPLQFSAAREIDVKGGRKAIVIFVPVPQLKAFHKVQGRYVDHHSRNGTGDVMEEKETMLERRTGVAGPLEGEVLTFFVRQSHA